MSADRATRNPAHAERTCPICWDTFTPVQPRHTYCSQRCRKTAYQRRQADPRPTVGDTISGRETPQPTAARACPHCGETITIVALLTTPEAARPSLPDIGGGVIPLRR